MKNFSYFHISTISYLLILFDLDNNHNYYSMYTMYVKQRLQIPHFNNFRHWVAVSEETYDGINVALQEFKGHDV